MRRLAVLALLCACGGPAEERGTAPQVTRAGEAYTGSLSPRPTPEAFAVATVDGDTIWDVDVARYAADHGLDARTALAELVDLTVLAQEAHRRGLSQDPEVVEARARERVRLLMQREFAPTFDGPEDVPQADLQMAWRQREIYLYFNHVLYHRVRFVRVPVKKKADEATIEAARLVAEDLHAALAAAAPRDKAEFDAALLAWRKQHPTQKLEIDDYAASQGAETAPRFRDLAFSIDEVGELSKVGRTLWGWDILFLYEILPETKHTLAQATPELQKRLFETSQQGGFLRWVDGLAAGYRIVRRDELLDQVEVESSTPAAP